jgi:polar amino acid transport system ATP-binding protein
MLKERSLNAICTEVGVAFQSFNLFPHLSVLHNITVGPRMLLGASKVGIETAALALLEKVGLAIKAHAMLASHLGWPEAAYRNCTRADCAATRDAV